MSDEFKRLFKQIAKTESGGEQNLEEIEIRLAHLGKSAALSYDDLEIIADPQYWPFSKYWIWPVRSQIEKKLESTAGWFKSLPYDEAKIIGGLDRIFKNIALVSIILRFARPEYYAIYSCPVLHILRIERGRNEIEEYLNYIREMRILRNSFSVDKTSEVDKIIWAIFHFQGKYETELKKILAKRLPENLTAKELIIYLSHDPIKIAKEYLKRKDHMTAGLWAAKAFEKFLDDECRSSGIYVAELLNRISSMIRELCAHTWHWKKRENQKLLYEVKKMRNTIIHDILPISYSDVEGFVSNIEMLKKIAVFKSY